MSKIDADLDRAAAAYWTSLANKGAAGKTTALLKANRALRAARAEDQMPDSAKQPTLNDYEAPQIEAVKNPRIKR